MLEGVDIHQWDTWLWYIVRYETAGWTYSSIGEYGTIRQIWGLGELELSKILSQFSETNLEVEK